MWKRKRIKPMSKTETAISQMEQWALDDTHGYDQEFRWGEYGDYDCSSAVITAWELAGVPVKTCGATTTWTMLPIFLALGFVDITASVNLETGEGLKRGDILLNRKDHVAMYCGDGKEVEASINENGGITGGESGDQTGFEFLIRPYRNYPWTNVLRYNECNRIAYYLELEPVYFGSIGTSVLTCQKLLACCGLYHDKFDGIAGTNTVNGIIEFQRILASEGVSIVIDGGCEELTWEHLIKRSS